jgi:hypothetical protein
MTSNGETKGIYSEEFSSSIFKSLLSFSYPISDSGKTAASITEQPSRILVLDVSLNDLRCLPHEGLRPLKQLREVNASLNHIYEYVSSGIFVGASVAIHVLKKPNLRKLFCMLLQLRWRRMFAASASAEFVAK